MLPKKKIKGLVEYWVKNSEEKFKTLGQLYESKCYPDVLFYGHMILEMILKAFVVHTLQKPSPKIHNLNRLAELGKVDLNDQELGLLSKANRFNLEGRYPNEKLVFYEICTKPFTDEFYQPIINLYQKLCQNLKSEK